MDAELADGGREALLHDLSTFDLTQVDLRQIPRTAALFEQKVRSFHSIDAWWFDRLQSGEPTHGLGRWPPEIAKAALVDDYVKHSERIGQKRKASDTELAMKLRKIVPELKDRVGWIDAGPDATRRCAMWVLPSLDGCRAAYAESLQQDVEWPQPLGERAAEDG
jgi:hypothetical protein